MLERVYSASITILLGLQVPISVMCFSWLLQQRILYFWNLQGTGLHSNYAFLLSADATLKAYKQGSYSVIRQNVESNIEEEGPIG